MSKRLPEQNVRALDKRARAIQTERQRAEQKGDSNDGRHYNIDE